MLVITVRHATTYRYKQPVAFGEHRMMLRPRDSYDQKLLDAKLAITPEPADIRWVHDVFGNCVAIARFAGRAQELDIESVIRLDHSPTNALDFEIEEYAKRYPFTYGADEMPDLLRSIWKSSALVGEWSRRMTLSMANSSARPANRAIATQLPKTSCTQRTSAGSGLIASLASSSFWS